MKLQVEKIEKSSDKRFKLIVYFKYGGELVKTKLTKEHIDNLLSKNKLPQKLRVGQVLNVFKRVGRANQDLFYIYDYEK